VHEDTSVLWTGQIPGTSVVHGWWQVRRVVGARARARCTCAEEGDRKGAELCMYFVLYFSRLDGFKESKRRVLQIGRIPRTKCR
jgi:hypothetical protein